MQCLQQLTDVGALHRPDSLTSGRPTWCIQAVEDKGASGGNLWLRHAQILIQCFSFLGAVGPFCTCVVLCWGPGQQAAA